MVKRIPTLTMPLKPLEPKFPPHIDKVNGCLQQIAANRRTLQQPIATKPGVWKFFKEKFQDDISWASTTRYNRYLHQAGHTITKEIMNPVIHREFPAWAPSLLASGSSSMAPTPTPLPSSTGLAAIFQLPLPAIKPQPQQRSRANTVTS